MITKNSSSFFYMIFILTVTFSTISCKIRLADSKTLNGSKFIDSYDNPQVFSRKVVYTCRGYNFMLNEGVVSIKICIDRDGNVISSQIIRDETTETNRHMLTKYLRLVEKYKYEKNPLAPIEECGKTKIIVTPK